MQKHLWTAFSCPNTRIDLFRPSTVSGVMLIFNLPFSRIPRILMPNFLRMYAEKTKPQEYIPQYTIEEAKAILQELTPWIINWEK